MAYATVAELRALDGLADTATYPDETLQAGIDYATETIDAYCLGGGSFEPAPFRVRLLVEYADPYRPLFLTGVRGPRTVTKATWEWDPTEPIDVSGWAVDPDFDLVTPDTALLRGVYVIEGTASPTETAPAGIAWACRTLARQWVLDLHSRVPDRALSLQADYGQVQLAQAGGQPDRPTSLPDVNVVLNRHRHRPPPLG